MSVEISVHRSVPRNKLETLLSSVPDKVRKEIDLPVAGKISEFAELFLKNDGVMMLAEKEGQTVGTVFAVRSLNYYLSRRAIVSKEDPIKISKIDEYELTGAYVTPEFRKYGVYSQLETCLYNYSKDNGLGLYLMVRPHPEAQGQALRLLSMIMGRPAEYIKDNYEAMLPDFEGVEIPRNMIEPLEPSLGLVNRESVSLYHRCIKRLDENEMKLLGYWVASFSPVFKYVDKPIAPENKEEAQPQ